MSATHGCDDALHLAREVEIVSDTSYRFKGELRDVARPGMVLMSETGQPVELQEPSSLLVTVLASELYQRAYRRPADGIGRSVIHGTADSGFVERLSLANTGQGTWEPGWRVVAVDAEGMVGVRREVTVCWVPPHHVRPMDGDITRGAPCRVRVPKEIRHLVLGYYMAIGDTEPAHTIPGPDVVRLYWNLTPASAITYIELITRTLNRSRVPFRTKVVSHSQMYGNADSGVLYLDRSDYTRARDPLREVHAALHDGLRDVIPLFTRPIAHGVGLAEDPGDGTSFGQSRCQLAARGLWLAHVEGARTASDRAAGVARSFERAGLDPARPYLCATATDIYQPLYQPIGQPLYQPLGQPIGHTPGTDQEPAEEARDFV